MPILEIVHPTLAVWVERALILEKAVAVDDNAYKTGEKILCKYIEKMTILIYCDFSSFQGYKPTVTVGNLGKT